MKYLLSIIFIGIIAVGGMVVYMYSQVRFDAYKIIDYKPKLTTQIFDRNHELVANIFEGENRLYVKYKDIPPRMVEALLAIEDTSFFEHGGINFEAIFRALIKDIKAMKLVEGASTLTQQLIKNTVLTRKKTLSRKLNEAMLAFKLESVLTKEQILERYMNQVYFGHGYYGIKTAARGYFNKNLDQLSLKEIAILVGLPRAPSAYDPTRHIDISLSRANRVIYRMFHLGWISKQEYEKATREYPVVYDETLTKNKAPYVVDEVIKRLSKKYSDLKTGGYKIYLGLDLKLQELARESLKVGYDGILKRQKDENASNLNGAMMVLDNKTGDIRAMVGGVDYTKSHFNRATQSKRQPGSSFKPFIYLQALNVGYNAQSKIPDISRVYVDKKTDKEWKPKNYEENFEGMITLKNALVHSRNLATINLLDSLGMDDVHRKLKDEGFKNLPNDLSIALGTFGISPYDFSGFYTTFSNYGERVKPRLITKIINKFGDEQDFGVQKTKITSPAQAYLMIDILKSVVSRGTGRKANVKGVEVAGKTGTTNRYVDAWFCGFTPDIEVVTWYGNDDNTPMGRGETGGRSAGPSFKHFVQNYLRLYPQTQRRFNVPDGVKYKTSHNTKLYFTDTSPLPSGQNPENQNQGNLIF
ncbi:penicillin-binding protein 1A [Sulfurospirillum sp. 1612]|uniref:penicillin-binding protein 1A n=1 Tax=Sulfurospirillum sp. 1612 TaxID=3094835 RepID=UPI002F94814B